MNLDILKNAGLAQEEIKIYQALLENGGLSAGKIITTTGLKRGDCYNKIYDLKDRGLITETAKNKKKFFELEPPGKIENYLNRQIENLTLTEKEIKSVLPNIISTYNLSYHKPGVQFFEGLEGVRQSAWDSLNAKTEILSYVDTEAVEKYIPKLNKEYIKVREKLGKKKRFIVSGSSYNKKYFKKLGPKTSDVGYIDYELPPFSTNMMIYDDKIFYMTMKPGAMIGVIIEDKYISRMHRALFEYTWKTAKKKN